MTKEQELCKNFAAYVNEFGKESVEIWVPEGWDRLVLAEKYPLNIRYHNEDQVKLVAGGYNFTCSISELFPSGGLSGL